MPRRSFLSVVERENLIALPAFHSCSLVIFCCAGFITCHHNLEHGSPTANRQRVDDKSP